MHRSCGGGAPAEAGWSLALPVDRVLSCSALMPLPALCSAMSTAELRACTEPPPPPPPLLPPGGGGGPAVSQELIRPLTLQPSTHRRGSRDAAPPRPASQPASQGDPPCCSGQGLTRGQPLHLISISASTSCACATGLQDEQLVIEACETTAREFATRRSRWACLC